jgi:hypothetical protein
MKSISPWLPVILLTIGVISCSVASTSTTSSTTTFGTDVPDCSSGTITTNIDSNVPAWVQNNFTCVRAFMSGTNIVIETRSLPPYTSYYYGASTSYAARHDTTAPTTPNPNVIATQTVVMTVPSSPAVATSQVSSGLGIVGIAVNGVVLFNDSANPPDNIADELATMDSHGGHPTLGGIYHYHNAASAIYTLSNDTNGVLLGIALDGFPIYGKKNSSGTLVFASGNNWVAANGDTALTTYPHYHAVYNNYLTTSSGTSVELAYLIGDYMAGTKGTVTSN